MGVLSGIGLLIVPEPIPESDPIITGEEKLPDALLSCNVNVLPAVKSPVAL